MMSMLRWLWDFSCEHPLLVLMLLLMLWPSKQRRVPENETQENEPQENEEPAEAPAAEAEGPENAEAFDAGEPETECGEEPEDELERRQLEQLGFTLPKLKGPRSDKQQNTVYVEQQEDDTAVGGYVDEASAEAGFEDEWEMEKRPRGQEPELGRDWQRKTEERQQAAHQGHHHVPLQEQEPPHRRMGLPLARDNALINALLGAEVLGPPKAYRGRRR